MNKKKRVEAKKTIEEIKWNTNKYFINPKGDRREGERDKEYMVQVK